MDTAGVLGNDYELNRVQGESRRFPTGKTHG